MKILLLLLLICAPQLKPRGDDWYRSQLKVGLELWSPVFCEWVVITEVERKEELRLYHYKVIFKGEVCHWYIYESTAIQWMKGRYSLPTFKKEKE